MRFKKNTSIGNCCMRWKNGMKKQPHQHQEQITAVKWNHIDRSVKYNNLHSTAFVLITALDASENCQRFLIENLFLSGFRSIFFLFMSVIHPLQSHFSAMYWSALRCILPTWSFQVVYGKCVFSYVHFHCFWTKQSFYCSCGYWFVIHLIVSVTSFPIRFFYSCVIFCIAIRASVLQPMVLFYE